MPEMSDKVGPNTPDFVDTKSLLEKFLLILAGLLILGAITWIGIAAIT